jgi:uncharacterized protein involved in cysteine biosynthesis
MLAMLARTFRQLDDPTIRRVIWFGVAMAALVLAATWFGLAHLLDGRVATGIAWLDGPLNQLVQLLGATAVAIMAWLFYPGLAGAFVGIFLEDVAAAVERRHYPDLPPARAQSIGEMIVVGLRFAAVTVALNLLVLPIYLLVPALNLAVFLLLNGWLLGRGFYEVVALRRLAPEPAAAVRRTGRMKLLLPGIVIALGMTVPVLNLLAPVLATILMVHVFHSLPGRQKTWVSER